MGTVEGGERLGRVMKTSEKIQASQLVDEALADFVTLQARVRRLEDLTRQKGASMALRNVLGSDRYNNLLEGALGSTAYGISVGAMGREDLMVLIILYAESSVKISQEIMRHLGAVYGD